MEYKILPVVYRRSEFTGIYAILGLGNLGVCV